MRYQAPPYMHDVLPIEPSKDAWRHVARWQAVERCFRQTCRNFGYREIRTPVMESTELFTRSIGQGTDIVSKEMFTFADRGGRSMTLRPEGTAPVMRSLIENGLLGDGGIAKVYYIATIYRYERGQRGRYREHQQTGIEAVGSADPAVDAEVIGLALEFYRRLGIRDTELRLNSVGCPACRPAYREALVDYASARRDQLSDDNRSRLETNPLRMLDSKDPRDHQALSGAPTLGLYLCSECNTHFEALQEHLRTIGAPFRLDARLVRGFDYYTKTAFEITSSALGAQDSIGGGGRYDGLIEECGGPPTPGIGFGIGTERCLLVLDQLGVDTSTEPDAPTAFLVCLGDAAKTAAVGILHRLRQAGVAADMDYCGRSMRGQMRAAGKCEARHAVIIGDSELERGVAAVKNLIASSEQHEVALADLAGYLARPTEGA